MKPTDGVHPRVAEALEASGVPFKVWHHRDCGTPIANPQDFANALGRSIDCIAKSLLLRANTTPVTFGIGVCSVPKRMDFAGIATLLGARRVQVGSEAELESQLAYPPGGVSPLGCGDIPVVLDSRLLELPSVFVGAGIRGVEIELAPADLQQACRARSFDFAT